MTIDNQLFIRLIYPHNISLNYQCFLYLNNEGFEMNGNNNYMMKGGGEIRRHFNGYMGQGT